MGRRSDHSREELAGLVIAAARAITVKEGWRAVTMRRIGAEIGYAAGSIYNAVGDIDAVLLRVSAGTLDELANSLESAIALHKPKDGPVAAALVLADIYIDYVIAYSRLWSVLMERSPPQKAPDWYTGPRGRLLALVEAVLTPLYPDPSARRRSVVALWAALQGVAGLTAGGNLAFAAKELDAHEIARSLVKRYLAGEPESRLA
jgi:AcrR family transcriptional regulator